MITPGKDFIVDDDLLKCVSALKWGVQKADGRQYFYTTIGCKKIYLHRFIAGLFSDHLVDHIDGNTSNNSIDNLRFCDHSGNMSNCKRRRRKNPYRGIYKHRNKWAMNIQKDMKNYVKHGFETALEAAKEYDRMAIELFGDFATLNFPKEKAQP